MPKATQKYLKFPRLSRQAFSPGTGAPVFPASLSTRAELKTNAVEK
jgi:hypothetical protein